MKQGRKGFLSIENKKKIIKYTLYTVYTLFAVCVAFLIVVCIWPDIKLLMQLFKCSGICCLIACALLTIEVSSWPGSLSQQVYADSAIPLNCHTPDSFKEAFVNSIESKGFNLVRKTQLESGALFLCFLRDGSTTQYIVLSLSSEFGDYLFKFSRDYVKSFLPTGYSSERTSLTHIICTSRYSTALMKFFRMNTIAPVMDQFRFTVAVSLEDAMLYMSWPKGCQGCWTLRSLEKQLIYYMQPLFA